MVTSKKMKISDLQQGQPDPIDWNALDTFFNRDAPNVLAQPLLLANIIKQNNILSIPEINSTTVTNYLSGMTADTQKLSEEYRRMKDKYVAGKNMYMNNYNENAHMFSLSVSHDMVEWLEQFEGTVGQNLNDVIDYMNSVLPDDGKINI